jgi:hypothetical protein
MGIKHVAELGTPRLYFYSLTLRVFRRSSKYQFYRLWFDPVEELPYWSQHTCLYRFHIVNVIVNVPIVSAAAPRLGQTKVYKIDICCFSEKHAALKSKNKDEVFRVQHPSTTHIAVTLFAC